MFYLSKETFGGVVISVTNGLKSEASSLQCCFEMGRVIDEKHGVGDVVFLAELPKKSLRQRCRCRRKQPNVEESVRVGIDGGVQLILVTVDPDHRFVERDPIRSCTVCWL